MITVLNTFLFSYPLKFNLDNLPKINLDNSFILISINIYFHSSYCNCANCKYIPWWAETLCYQSITSITSHNTGKLMIITSSGKAIRATLSGSCSCGWDELGGQLCWEGGKSPPLPLLRRRTSFGPTARWYTKNKFVSIFNYFFCYMVCNHW